MNSALYIDFDNVFRCLWNDSPFAAKAFAQQPQRWLQRLTEGAECCGGVRRFVDKRVYLNAYAYVRDGALGVDGDYLRFGKFRRAFADAGFDVVNCPGGGGKNAADMTIAVHVMNALHSGRPVDEVFVGSSDFDFRPLLAEVKYRGLRTAVLSAGPSRPSYRSVADVVIERSELLDLVSSNAPSSGENESNQADREKAERERAAWQLVKRSLARSSSPLLLSALGSCLRLAHGQCIRSSEWFGAGKLSSWIRAQEDPWVQVSAELAWDPSRHEEPATPRGARRTTPT